MADVNLENKSLILRVFCVDAYDRMFGCVSIDRAPIIQIFEIPDDFCAADPCSSTETALL